MIAVREAVTRILAGVPVLEAGPTPLLEAQGRVLAEDVTSPLDLPPRTNSAMDGYATRSEDVRGASREQPRRLRVIETVHAGGGVPARRVGPGEATRIFTGAFLPDGADGVIRQEDTEAEGGDVVILSDRDAGRNIRLAGEDLRRGETVFRAGQPLGAAQLGVLASMARATVHAFRPPRVAILASGDEIADLDEAEAILRGEKIASSNSYTLHALIRDAGAVPVPLGIARDTLASVRDLFSRGIAEADLLVSTAGVSVGERDYVRDALAELGATMDFWRVRMRPGSPLGFAHVGGKPWIGLPGNPVSTMVCFELFVRPAIRKMQGHRALHRRTATVTLEEEVRTAGKLTHFLRAVVGEGSEGEGKGRGEGSEGRKGSEGMVARLTGPQGSGILTSMARANALLVVPEDVSSVPPGATLTAILLGETWGYAERPPL